MIFKQINIEFYKGEIKRFKNRQTKWFVRTAIALILTQLCLIFVSDFNIYFYDLFKAVLSFSFVMQICLFFMVNTVDFLYEFTQVIFNFLYAFTSVSFIGVIVYTYRIIILNRIIKSPPVLEITNTGMILYQRHRKAPKYRLEDLAQYEIKEKRVYFGKDKYSVCVLKKHRSSRLKSKAEGKSSLEIISAYINQSELYSIFDAMVKVNENAYIIRDNRDTFNTMKTSMHRYYNDVSLMLSEIHHMNFLIPAKLMFPTARNKSSAYIFEDEPLLDIEEAVLDGKRYICIYSDYEELRDEYYHVFKLKYSDIYKQLLRQVQDANTAIFSENESIGILINKESDHIKIDLLTSNK